MQKICSRTNDILIEHVKRDANYTNQSSHYHPYYELGFVLNGTRSMTINHSSYNLEKGNVVFIAKGELHKGFPVEHYPSSVELINLYFTENYLQPFTQLFGSEDFSSFFMEPVFILPANRREYIEDLLRKMLTEYESIDELSKLLTVNYFQELISFLIRYKRKNDFESSLQMNNNELEDAVKYIYFNYNKELSLKQIAKKYNMSESYFSRKFKATTGFGFKEYLISVRLKEACNLLLTSDATITEIAYQCGFNDSNYFGDAFRKANGVSPYKYRKYNGLL